MLELQLLMQELKSQPVHKLLAKQLERAAAATGEVDLQKLAESVSAAYEELDRDRRRSSRSIELMIDEVQASQKRLLEALDIVPEGFALFDAEDRFVLWNHQYTEMYSDNHDLIAVGKRFEDVLREGIARGHHPGVEGKEEEWVAQRLALHALPQSTHEQQLPDGRWLRVEERRTADGGSIGVRVDITDLKRREASFRLLFDSNPVPMWLFERASLRFLAVNDAAVEHYGYSRDQFLAMTLLDIRPLAERERVKQDLKKRANDLPQGRARRHIKADGTQIDVSIYAQDLQYEGRDARLVAVIDITAQKRAEKELRDTREFLRTIIENVPAAIYVKELPEFRYILVNRAGEQFFSCPRKDIIGKTAHDFFPPDAAETIVARDRLALESDQDHIYGENPIHSTVNGWEKVSVRRIVVRDAEKNPQYLLTVIENLTGQRQAEARAAHLARHDALTDLPNRASFNESFQSTLARAASSGKQFAVMSVDLDRFKEINDVFGHAVGDALLCEVSRRLKKAATEALLAHFGGDEFALIFADGQQPAAAEMLANRLFAAMADEFEIEGHRFLIGMSVGVAIYPFDGSDSVTLLGNADAALYRAKAEGRGAIRFFAPEMDTHLRERRAMERDLRSAIKQDELSLHYQPLVKIDGEIVGFEALLRWQHPGRGMVSPANFIPVAEESGLIIPIGEWTLRAACREAASWKRPLNIAVNMSPAQFRHAELPNLVHSVLFETGLNPARLEIEITESVLIDDFSRTVSTLRRLKALGVRIAMDDFGTGYSSLSYLQSFPFDKIKIDRSFIANIDRNPQSAAIVRAVIGLGRGLGLPVTAEGVETEGQLAFLRHEACDEVQGFLLGRPQPISEYAAVVGRQPGPARKLALAG